MLFSPNLTFLFFLLHFVSLFILRLVRNVQKPLVIHIYASHFFFFLYLLEKRNWWTQVLSKLCDVILVIITFLLEFEIFSPSLKQFLNQQQLSASQYRDFDVEHPKNKPNGGFFSLFWKWHVTQSGKFIINRMLKILSTKCALNQ